MNASSWKILKLFSTPISRWARLIVALSLLSLAGCAMYEHALRPKVPPILQIPAGHKLLLPLHAKGVQIYRGELNPTNPAQLIWVLKAPEAMLFDNIELVIGSHYAGPTWESDGDHSKVVGEVMQRVASPLSNAIPWLLLRAKANEGPGLFQRATFIQRVNTKGGIAPTTAPTQTGQEVRVRYTAEYYFYRAGN